MRYDFVGGSLALDFTNTVHSHGTADPEDDLKSVTNLVEWAVQARVLQDRDARHARRVRENKVWFRRALTLRELLYDIFSCAAQRKRPNREALKEFEGLYRNAARDAEFQLGADHYRLTWPATDPLQCVVQEIIRSAAELLTSNALSRVRQCSGEACSWLFVDNSRNGMRRWCEMRACGNRAKVRRFRALRQTGRSGRRRVSGNRRGRG
ncbi:MAG TPA: ABATE domain-containing protein [Terriglobales bacterium]|nr:ABATE domain-containing protein [Terriglobales bacterium]